MFANVDGGGGGLFGGGGAFGDGGSHNSVGGGFGGTAVGAYGGFVPSTHGLGDDAGVGNDRSVASVRPDQSLMPLTVRMLLDAYDQVGPSGNGPDTSLVVNGKELSMFTFVAQVETLREEPTFRCYNVNDSTGRIAVKYFNDGGPLSGVDVRVGEHVRVVGSLRCWGSDLHVSAQNVARLESPDELSFHFVEVVHVHLGFAGKLPKKEPVVVQTQAPVVASPARGQTQSGTSMGQPCFKCGQTTHWAKDCPNTGIGSKPPAAVPKNGASPLSNWMRTGAMNAAPPQLSTGSYGTSAAPMTHTNSYGAPLQTIPAAQYGFGGTAPVAATAQSVGNPYR